jgi:hypothetical protein
MTIAHPIRYLVLFVVLVFNVLSPVQAMADGVQKSFPVINCAVVNAFGAFGAYGGVGVGDKIQLNLNSPDKWTLHFEGKNAGYIPFLTPFVLVSHSDKVYWQQFRFVSEKMHEEAKFVRKVVLDARIDGKYTRVWIVSESDQLMDGAALLKCQAQSSLK